jgi:hypothetical protein
MDEYELQRLEHNDVTDWVATLYAQSGRTAQKQWEHFASDSATVCLPVNFSLVASLSLFEYGFGVGAHTISVGFCHVAGGLLG